MAAETVLKLNGITKRFGSLVANHRISLDLKRGEVLALLGENGAGKSTLMSILFGHYTADEGTIEAFGHPLPPGKPRAALAAGIGMVHQHFALADNLTVLDNVLLGTESMWAFRSHRSAARQRLSDIAQRFGLAVEPDARIGGLSVGQRQRVEILKALYRGAKILILDEPTAVLTPQESQALFDTLRHLVADGLSIIFISHKLDEVLAVSDRIAILRRGELVADMPVEGASKAQLAEIMVGRKVSLPKVERRADSAEAKPRPTLSLTNVHTALAEGQKGLHGLSFAVYPAEIVAVAGVSGNGQAVLADLLSGLVRPSQGRVELADQPAPQNPRSLTQAGVGRVPEDRHGVGVIGDLAVWENTITEAYPTRRFSAYGLLKRGAAVRHAEELGRAYDVRMASIQTVTRTLSGGNIQKLVLGRVLSESPRLLVANQPTWGLDIGAVAYVHQQLLAARERGAAILLISEDLDEIFALADRIGVMHDGRLSPFRPAEAWTLASIGLAMAGAHA